MGLFSSVKKAFKKITKGVSKVIKKGVNAVKKVVKKVSKSKVLRTLAIAAAAVVTGGAALGAFPGLASTQLGSAIVSAGQWVSGLPVVGTLAKPFQAAGSFVGETAYAAAGKMGLIKDVDMAAKTLANAGQGSYASIKEAIANGLTSEAEVMSKASAFVSEGAKAIATAPTLGTEELANLTSKELTPASFSKTVGGTLGAIGKPLVGVGKQIALGYGKALLTEDEQLRSGVPFAADEEQATQLAQLQVSYSNANADMNDIYDKSFTFGTGDPSYLYNSNNLRGPDPLQV